MSSFLNRNIDFQRHNDEVRRVMEAFNAGRPIRVPVHIYGSITNYFHNSDLNRSGLTFEQFFTDARVQIQAQLEYQYWRRHNLLCDMEMGLPEAWQLSVDFQNSLDASWMGAPVKYNGRYLPDTLPIFAKEKKRLYDMPRRLPVESGLVKTGMELIDEMEDYCRSHEFMGRPIRPPRAFAGEGTDGVFDLAYKLRGAENLLVDMLEDEEYYSDLMEWITENLIARIRELRRRHQLKWGDCPAGFGYADDAIALISHEMYREYVLPYHERIIREFNGGQKIWLHLCGGNMHHFGGLVQELPVGTLDTGFPIDFDRLRGLIGDDVIVQGGPTIMLMREGTQQSVREETRRILQSGVADSGRFVLIAANNLAPCTPVENIAAMYEAAKQYGTYPLTR